MRTVDRRMFVGLFVVVALFLAACVAPPATGGQGAAGAPAASSEPSVINVYNDGDTNISDWYMNVIVPAFEKQYPQYKLNFVNVRGVGEGTKSIADRALAALQTELDVLGNPQYLEAGLWLKLDEAGISNAKNIAPAGRVSEFSMAYRGSQVLLAYDSSKVAENEVPKTFADLITWIKANPGQFAYCRPDKGGSGGNFVVRAIYEATGKDPSIFKPGTPDPALLAEFDKAWALLSEIHPAIYDNGSYPAGNNPTLELLANGSVSMISAWSDQALQAIANGALPETTKLLQFSDLPMPGGYAYYAVPKNTKNPQGALDFINFMLSQEMQVSVVNDIGGFPAVNWSELPTELQSQFTSVITENVPNWPGGEWSAARNKGWYEKVATNISPDQ
jgi:putative spermidine/putrescine transport system substrate-binding protein